VIVATMGGLSLLIVIYGWHRKFGVRYRKLRHPLVVESLFHDLKTLSKMFLLANIKPIQLVHFTTNFLHAA